MICVKDLAAISLFTGTVLIEGDDIKYMYDILEKLEGRPVYTHEMSEIAEKHKNELSEMVYDIYKEAKESDKFIDMWNECKKYDREFTTITFESFKDMMNNEGAK